MAEIENIGAGAFIFLYRMVMDLQLYLSVWVTCQKAIHDFAHLEQETSHGEDAEELKPTVGDVTQQ